MDKKFKYVFFCIAITIVIGAISGGAVLCWLADKYTTCSDWSFTAAYAAYKCDFRVKLTWGLLNCNSTALCACYNIAFDTVCLDTVPATGTSGSLLIGGIVMIIIGLIGAVMIVIFIRSVMNE
jgi:hypothetical protein